MEQTILAASGLATSVNELTSAPGDLVKAVNCMLLAPDLMGFRRGQPRKSYSFGAVGDAANAMAIFGTVPVVQYTDMSGDGVLTRDTGSAFVDYAGTYDPPTETQRMRFLEAAQNLYFTSLEGVQRLDKYNGTPVLAGITTPKDISSAECNATTGGFLGPMQSVAYRITLCTKDSHGKVIESPPSGMAIVTNTQTLVAAYGTLTLASSSGTVGGTINGTSITTTWATSDAVTAAALAVLVNANATLAPLFVASALFGVVTITCRVAGAAGNAYTLTATGTNVTASGAGTLTGGAAGDSLNVDLEFPLGDGTYTTRQFFRVYRSQQCPGVGPGIPVPTETVAPTDEEFLVFERYITSDDIEAGGISFTDTTDDAVLTVPLYTNFFTGQGESSANDTPPFCRDITWWDDCAWYWNIRQRQSVALNIIGCGPGEDGSTGIRLGDTISLEFEGGGGSTGFTAWGAYEPDDSTFKLFTDSDDVFENVANTARSLVNLINESSATYPLRAQYLGNGETSFGAILIEAQDLTTPAFRVLLRTGVFSVVSPFTPAGGITIETSQPHGFVAGDTVFLYSQTPNPYVPPGTHTVLAVGADDPYGTATTFTIAGGFDDLETATGYTVRRVTPAAALAWSPPPPLTEFSVATGGLVRTDDLVKVTATFTDSLAIGDVIWLEPTLAPDEDFPAGTKTVFALPPDDDLTAASYVSAVLADETIAPGFGAVAAGNVVTLTAPDTGTGGNSITLALIGVGVAVSGPTFTGGAMGVKATGTVTFTNAVGDEVGAAIAGIPISTPSLSSSADGFYYEEAGADATSTEPYQSGARVTSSDNATSNGAIYSKKSEFGVPGVFPEACPKTANLLPVGIAHKQTLRALALDQNQFVFNEDGIYIVSYGSGQNPYTVDPLNSTVHIVAPDTAVVCNGLAFALTNKGVVTCTNAGVQVISGQIEQQLLQWFGPSFESLKTDAWACARETDGLYILGLPALEGADAPYDEPVMFVYSTRARRWTGPWTKDWRFALVRKSDDALYFVSGLDGASTAPTLAVENNTKTAFDYADDVTTLEVVSWDEATKVLRVRGTVGVHVGDAIGWDSSGITPEFDPLLVLAIDSMAGDLTLSGTAGFLPPVSATGTFEIEDAYGPIAWLMSHPGPYFGSGSVPGSQDVGASIGGYPSPFQYWMTSDDATAALLVDVFNTSPGIEDLVSATALGNVVTVEALVDGTGGNGITLFARGTGVVASGLFLTGGAPGVKASGTITIVNARGMTDAEVATALAIDVAANFVWVTTEAVGGLVTVTAGSAFPGAAGNAIAYAGSGAGLTLGGAHFTGGTNSPVLSYAAIPYDIQWRALVAPSPADWRAFGALHTHWRVRSFRSATAAFSTDQHPEEKTIVLAPAQLRDGTIPDYTVDTALYPGQPRNPLKMRKQIPNLGDAAYLEVSIRVREAFAVAFLNGITFEAESGSAKSQM